MLDNIQPANGKNSNSVSCNLPQSDLKKIKESLFTYGDKSAGNGDGIVNREDFASNILWGRVSQYEGKKWADVKKDISNFIKSLKNNNLISVSDNGNIISRWSDRQFEYDKNGTLLGGVNSNGIKWSKSADENGNYYENYENGWSYKYTSDGKYIGGTSPQNGKYNIEYAEDNTYSAKYENGSYEKFNAKNELIDYKIITMSSETKIKQVETPGGTIQYDENGEVISSITKNGNAVHIEETFYDENGNKIIKSKESDIWNYKSEKTKKTAWHKEEIYDKKTGLLTRTNYLRSKYSTRYEYNSDGKMTKAVSTGEPVRTEYVSRGKNRNVLKEIEYYNPDTGKIFKRETTDYMTYTTVEEYDDNGKVTNKTVQDNVNKKYNISGNNATEGNNRIIKEIYVSSALESTDTYKELKNLGTKLGFKVSVLESRSQWLEDVGVKRHDGKMLIVPKEITSKINLYTLNRIGNYDNYSRRKGISEAYQGVAARYVDSFANTIPAEKRVYAKSYLEGGNVLNTTLKNGKPGAIVGEESIEITLNALRLETNEENISKVKKQIASDLGLEEKDVTFIPQYDFHIDMLYRPLGNGEVAVPDFDEAIKILQEGTFKEMSEKDKNKLISDLQALLEKTKDIRTDAEGKLAQGGYKIVKIPCFTTDSNSTINFMNGVGGTTAKGKTYYITNKSKYEELNNKISEYFKKSGINSVYFVDTSELLVNSGGLDCVTKEEAR